MDTPSRTSSTRALQRRGNPPLFFFKDFPDPSSRFQRLTPMVHVSHAMPCPRAKCVFYTARRDAAFSVHQEQNRARTHQTSTLLVGASSFCEHFRDRLHATTKLFRGTSTLLFAHAPASCRAGGDHASLLVYTSFFSWITGGRREGFKNKHSAELLTQSYCKFGHRTGRQMVGYSYPGSA